MRGTGGARPQAVCCSTVAGNRDSKGCSSQLAANKEREKAAGGRNRKKSVEIARADAEGAGAPVAPTIREPFLSSTRTCWLCRSSVMEMTKNRMTRAQHIATIFCSALTGRSGELPVRESAMACARIPAMATQTQTRLSVNSITSRLNSDYSMSPRAFKHIDAQAATKTERGRAASAPMASPLWRRSRACSRQSPQWRQLSEPLAQAPPVSRSGNHQSSD